MSPRWMTRAFSFLLVFSFLAGALVVVPQGIRADPILPDYAYKVKITVAAHGSGALTDCQMSLQIFQGVTANSAGIVYLQNHALNWPYDIRFTDDTGTLLSYWRESDSDGALYWVKLPTIAAGSTTDYWLYYGYASATDVSNGNDTFIMYDNFLGGTLDSSIWDSTGTPTVGGGVMDIYTAADGIYSKTAFNSSCALRTRVVLQSGSSGAAGFVGFGTGQRGYTFDIYGGYPVANNINAIVNGDGGFSLGHTGANPYIYDVYRHGDEAGIWDSGVYKATLTGGSSANLYVHASVDSVTSPRLSLDWVAVRLSDAALPGWNSSGDEEENEESSPEPWAPTFTSSPDLTGQVGTSYSYHVTINETGTLASIVKPAWASWLSPWYNGVPTVPGVYAFQVQATSTAGTLTADQYWNVTVADNWAPAFTNSAGTTGTIGIPYSYSPTCNESVTYSLETKPDWAIMDEGEISGTPLASGNYAFELKATSDGGGLDTWQNWTVVVPDPVVPPVVDPFSDLTSLLASLMYLLLMIVILVAILTTVGRW